MNQIEKYIDSLEGYKISNTHFRIGERIHTNDFYYAKRLFQNSYYTVRIAYWIAYQIIKNKIDDKSHLTLVGYELYSVLTLSMVCDILGRKGFINVDYTYLTNNDKKLSFPPCYNSNIDNYIIVVPISSTGDTTIKMKHSVAKKHNNSTCIFSIQIITASDPKIENKYCNPVYNVVKLMTLKPTWFKSSSCPMCFCCNNTDSNDISTCINLKPLLSTDPSNLVPIQIFDRPELKETMSLEKLLNGSVDDGKINLYSYNGRDFKDVDYSKSLRYLHRIQDGVLMPYSNDTNQFIKANEKGIINWLRELGQKKIFNIKNTDDIVVLAPNNESNISFVTLVNKELFHFSAIILFYKQKTDFIENFKRINERYLDKNNEYRYFYVDDGLISGGTFFKLYDDFRFAANYQIKLDGAIVLSNYSSKEINRRVCNAVGRLHSFVSINNAILYHNVKIGLDKEKERYKYIAKETLYFRYHNEFKKKVEDLEEPSQKNNLNLTTNEWEKRKGKDRRHLIMFKSVHYLYELIGTTKNDVWTNIQFEDLVKHCDNIEKKEYNEEEWEFAIIKVLCQSPFSYYQPITQKTFAWVTEKLRVLQELMNDMTTLPFPKEDMEQIDCFNKLINRLKFYIRRAVILGNNYIICDVFFKSVVDFIDKIYPYDGYCKKHGEHSISDRELFTQSTQLQLKYEELHLYIAKQYIELIHGNHYVPFQLEKSLEKVVPNSPGSRQLVKQLDDECAIVLNNLYKLIEKEVSSDNVEKHFFNDESTLNKKINDKIEILKKNIVWEQIPQSLFNNIINGDSFIESFLFFCQIRYSIHHLFDPQKDEKNKESLLNGQIKKIFRWLRMMAMDSHMGSFLIVKDCFNQRQVVYDMDENNRQILNVEDSELLLFDSLLGISGDADKEEMGMTLLSVQKENGEKWKDEYGEVHEKNGRKNIPVCFDEYNKLIVIRVVSSDEGEPLGIAGFYWKDMSGDISMFRKYILLLRKDFAAFINSHYQNSEFVQLRIVEERKKYISLFGHGQLTMEKIAEEDDNKDIFKPIVVTMKTLQYMVAFQTDSLTVQNSKDNVKKSLEKQFPPQKIIWRTGVSSDKNVTYIDQICEDMKKIAKSIFKSQFIEVELDEMDFEILTETEEGALKSSEFTLSIDIIKFILFELIVNAKKNRFILNLDNQCLANKKSKFKDFKNRLTIFFTNNGNNLQFGVESTSTKINNDIKKMIEGKVCDPYKPVAGVYLINEILKIMGENNIQVKSEPMDEYENIIYLNTISVCLKSL